MNHMNPILLFVIAYLVSHFYHGMGITIGYHRLLSHRAFKCPRWIEYFWVAAGYLAFEGSPLQWVATHRVHHRYTEKEGDPHSPVDGFWHSFLGWLYQPTVVLGPKRVQEVCPDLYRDNLYRFLDCNHTHWHALLCLFACIAARVALFVAFGPIVMAANILGAGTAFIAPHLVNSICHIPAYGYRNFEIDDDSRNVWWVGLVAAGEGWHNNHHAIPQSARHGLRPDEFDISWIAISWMEKIGLASNLRLPKQNPLAEAYIKGERVTPDQMSVPVMPTIPELEVREELQEA